MTTRIRATKKYKALRAIGLTDEAALAKLTPQAQPQDQTAQAIQALVAAGFTEEQAKALLTESTPEAEAPKSTPVKVLSSKEQAEALVEKSQYDFAKGRVYATSTVLEAAVRVLKTKTPEIVPTSGVGRTKAVALWVEASGDVVMQNLS